MRSGVIIRTGVALGGVVAALAAGLPAAAPAAAAPAARSDPGGVAARAAVAGHLDGQCDPGDVCLWYLANFQGSAVDFHNSDGNLSDNVFLTPGAGQWHVVANNSESVENFDPIWLAWLCTGINATGDCTGVRPHRAFNLEGVYRNNVESVTWG